MKGNLTSEFKHKSIELVEKMYEHQEISSKTRNFLLDGGTQTSLFYMLPKIHKQKGN